jgi:hypothetical protein
MSSPHRAHETGGLATRIRRRVAATSAAIVVGVTVTEVALVVTRPEAGLLGLIGVLAAHLALAGFAFAPFAALPEARALRIGLVALAVVSGARFGSEWLSLPAPFEQRDVIRVASWNLEVGARAAAATVAALRAVDADVVVLQELDHAAAASIESDPELLARFPFRALAPRDYAWIVPPRRSPAIRSGPHRQTRGSGRVRSARGKLPRHAITVSGAREEDSGAATRSTTIVNKFASGTAVAGAARDGPWGAALPASRRLVGGRHASALMPRPTVVRVNPDARVGRIRTHGALIAATLWFPVGLLLLLLATADPLPIAVGVSGFVVTPLVGGILAPRAAAKHYRGSGVPALFAMVAVGLGAAIFGLLVAVLEGRPLVDGLGFAVVGLIFLGVPFLILGFLLARIWMHALTTFQ